MKRLFPFLLLAGVAAAASAAVPPPPVISSAPVFEMSVTGAVDPAVARYVKEGLGRAVAGGAQMALISLDTPGGLLDATRDIVQAMLNAPLPVVVYVSPRGARATSAGLFLMMAADVAAMAPETHLGAAHPVSIGGGAVKGSSATADGGVMAEKSVSDAAAYVRALALEKDRNADWAEKAVRQSVSLTAGEALDQDVIDVVAESAEDLFARLHGGAVDKGGVAYDLLPAGAPRVRFEMPARLKILHAVANPNIAYLLLMIGVYALLYEFAAPGIGFGGVTGVICLALASFSLQVLPLNYAGLALLVAGLAMMAADHALGGHGFLMAGGAIAFGIGSFMLYGGVEGAPRVSLALIVGSMGAAVAFSMVVLKGAWAVRRMKPLTGREALIGRTAVVREGGLVFLEGQLWTADGYGPFAAGEKVLVTDVQGNTLKIEKV